MINQLRRVSPAFSVLVVGLLASANSTAQPVVVDPEQLLGTVEVISPGAVLDMSFDDPERMSDFDLLFPDSGADYTACARVPGEGIFCLDQGNRKLKKYVGSAPYPVMPPLPTPTEVLDCLSIPALSGRRGGDCIAYTYGNFDGIGGIHAIAANAKGKAFILNAITANSNCPAGTFDFGNGFCNQEIYTGRPLLNDLKPVQGAIAERFPLGAGFIGVEQRGDFMHYAVDPLTAEPTKITDKKALGLKGNVSIDAGDILQLTNPGNAALPFNYAVIVTDDGQLLTKPIGNSDPIVAFDLSTVPVVQAGAPFNADEPRWGLKIDESSGIAVVTDRNNRQAAALLPQVDSLTGKLVSWTVATETVTTMSGTTTEPLVLDTGAYDPVSVTSSPGKFINFFEAGCADPINGCLLISGNDDDGARFLDFDVVDTNNAEGVYYQIRDVPWCPLRPFTCIDVLETTEYDGLDASCAMATTRPQALSCLEASDVLRRVQGSPNTGRPEEFEYNYQPFLEDLIPNAQLFPPLWTGGPDVRGRPENDGLVGLIFFVTDAREQDVLTLETDAFELGSIAQSACELAGDLQGYDVNIDGLARLLDWDVVHRTSEKFTSFSIDDTGALVLDFTGTSINAGCGSSRSRAGGASGFIYDLELSPCPGTLENGNLVFDSQCTPGESTPTGPFEPADPGPADDAVFAKAFVSLFVDLRRHLDTQLCDTNILSTSDCNSLTASWLNTQDKLIKALDATIDPKTSAGAQNFGAVNSQLGNYLSTLLGVTPVGSDPANYYGENIARVETLQHVLTDKLAPSIPENGFVEPNREWALVSYP